MQQKQEEFQRFLEDRYELALHQAQQRALYHQQVTKRSEWILIIFSAITTVLLAISSFFKDLPITPFITICSTCATVIAAAMKTFDTQEKWSFYQKLESDLRDEYYLYSFSRGEYQQSTDKEGLFVERITALLKKARQERPRMTYIPSVDQQSTRKDQING